MTTEFTINLLLDNHIYAHTNFRTDTFETVHSEQQLQCSTQFVQSILKQLRSSVDALLQLQRNTSAQRKQAKENVFQTLTTAGVPKAIIDVSTKPLETEIEQIEAGIEEWNTFSAVLINTVNQLRSTSTETVSEVYAEMAKECK